MNELPVTAGTAVTGGNGLAGPSPQPVAETERIVSLDALRGLAVLGICR